MGKRNAAVLGTAALVCVLILLIGLRLNRTTTVREGANEPLYLLFTVDGQAEEPILLADQGEYIIARENARNVVRYTRDGIWMESATCHNQDCIRQGTVTRENRDARPLGNQIICLPNKVVLQLMTGTELAHRLSLP